MVYIYLNVLQRASPRTFFLVFQSATLDFELIYFSLGKVICVYLQLMRLFLFFKVAPYGFYGKHSTSYLNDF